MKVLKSKYYKILFSASKLEKKHKIVTYASLLLLTASTYLLRNETQTVSIQLATLREKNLHLKETMVIFNENYENLPLPVWQKVKRGKHFVMQYVNPAYVKSFGHLFSYNPLEQMGKNNFELFPQKIAQEFYEKDISVAITGEKLEIKGQVIGEDGKYLYAKTIKWREIRDNKDTLIYGMIREFYNDKE